MQQEPTGDHGSPPKTEKLRQDVCDATSDVARLAAQLALARHDVDPSDGVNGLATAREALKLALHVAEEDGDEMRIADRMANLGMVAMLTGNLDHAEDLLNESLRRSLSLDYVRTAVSSALYLGKIHLRRWEAPPANAMLRQTVSLATRGVAGDSLPAAQLLLADALEMGGEEYEAALRRTSSDKLRSNNAVSCNRAAEDARQLVAKVLSGGDGTTKP